jgi:hypothetical protein
VGLKLSDRAQPIFTIVQNPWWAKSTRSFTQKKSRKPSRQSNKWKGQIVRASERHVKNNEANPRQATRKKPQKTSQPWLIECIGDRSRTTMKNRTRRRIKWCPMWDNMDEKKKMIFDDVVTFNIVVAPFLAKHWFQSCLLVWISNYLVTTRG